MKKVTFFRMAATITGMVMISSNGFSQNEVAMPAGLLEHGIATESIDTVTVGATMQYWVQPDAAITGTNSTFTWTVPVALGSQTAGTPTNLADIQFSASPVASTAITVVETAPAGCADATPTSFNVAVINKPTATFGTDPSGQCTNTPSSVIFTLPITLTTDLPAGNPLTVNYTVTNPDASVLIPANDYNIMEATGTISVTLTGASQYGTYTVTINSVNDRISTKSNVVGTITDASIALVVNRTPVTGPVFHKKN